MKNNYFSHQRTELLEFIVPPIQTALDIGCASGNFGHLLKTKFNTNVWGIEPDQSAAALASSKLDRVINAPFTKGLDLGNQKFDYVFFNDVLEHLVDPQTALHLAKDYLNDDGIVIASIPNILHFDAIYPILKNRDWKYEEAGVMDKTHLRFFTKKSMIRLFEESGYSVDRIKGINAFYGRFVHYLNRFTFNRFDEIKYPQFVIRASYHG